MNKLPSVSDRTAWSIATFIKHLYAPEKWYKVALKVTGYIALFKPQSGLRYKNAFKIHHSVMLNAVLAELSKNNISFPIPIRAKGLELFQKSNPNPNGMILCAAHLPLIQMGLRYLVEQNLKPELTIENNLDSDGHVYVCGLTEPIPSARRGPYLYNETKNILQSGGSVAVLVDDKFGEAYCPKMFRLAQCLGSDLVYYFSELEPDGCIRVSYVASKAATNIELAMHQLKEQVNQILRAD